MIKSWMVIGGVTILLAMAIGSLGTLIAPGGIQWFNRLRRPSWLTFEKAIPLIWTIAFICGAWSATIVWEKDPGSRTTWLLMGFYLVVELVTLAYNPVMLALRSLRVGTIIGATGALLGALLALSVWPISGWAALLLLPYVLWSPIGTYTTWEMTRLNPADK
jgi:benzodiazapine receptor